MESVPESGVGGDVCVDVRNLSFSYENEQSDYQKVKGLHEVSFQVKKGSRVLVVGGNGAGKSTLLSILGGKKMINPGDSALILGRPVFNDTSLSRNVMYMGEWWKHEVFMDVTLADCLSEQLQCSRVKRLCRLLDVDLSWRISRVSDGQRRRCQLLANLAEPRDIYIMDEATTDLDVVARDSLMRMLREETENRNATILYATHIFDNLEGWPTHILYLKRGRIALFSQMDQVDRYHQLKADGVLNPLYSMVRDWLYEELADKQKTNGISDE
eukprot:GHVS01028268.1.p1 GENE.GHVS01028268.1~~GHVS01028268.1.p1  ORF type:complete len:271 (+),score=25.39 GHVS01028268.1:100-912(+)